MDREHKELLERAVTAEVKNSVLMREKEADEGFSWPKVVGAIIWALLIGYVVTVIFG